MPAPYATLDDGAMGHVGKYTEHINAAEELKAQIAEVEAQLDALLYPPAPAESHTVITLQALRSGKFTQEQGPVAHTQLLPLADAETGWNAPEAARAVAQWAGPEEMDWTSYSGAFLWHDASNAEARESYKLQVATVAEGKLVAVPDAIRAAARDCVEAGVLTESDLPAVKATLRRYFRAMGEDAPESIAQESYLRMRSEVNEYVDWDQVRDLDLQLSILRQEARCHYDLGQVHLQASSNYTMRASWDV